VLGWGALGHNMDSWTISIVVGVVGTGVVADVVSSQRGVVAVAPGCVFGVSSGCGSVSIGCGSSLVMGCSVGGAESM
jgi:hypothetical protein